MHKFTRLGRLIFNFATIVQILAVSLQKNCKQGRGFTKKEIFNHLKSCFPQIFLFREICKSFLSLKQSVILFWKLSMASCFYLCVGDSLAGDIALATALQDLMQDSREDMMPIQPIPPVGG